MLNNRTKIHDRLNQHIRGAALVVTASSVLVEDTAIFEDVRGNLTHVSALVPAGFRDKMSSKSSLILSDMAPLRWQRRWRRQQQRIRQAQVQVTCCPCSTRSAGQVSAPPGDKPPRFAQTPTTATALFPASTRTAQTQTRRKPQELIGTQKPTHSRRALMYRGPSLSRDSPRLVLSESLSLSLESFS